MICTISLTVIDCNRPWLGWEVSFRIVQFLHRERSTVQATILWALLMTLWSAFFLATVQLDYHTVTPYIKIFSIEHGLKGTRSLSGDVSFEPSQEEQSLQGLFQKLKTRSHSSSGPFQCGLPENVAATFSTQSLLLFMGRTLTPIDYTRTRLLYLKHAL